MDTPSSPFAVLLRSLGGIAVVLVGTCTGPREAPPPPSGPVIDALEAGPLAPEAAAPGVLAAVAAAPTCEAQPAVTIFTSPLAPAVGQAMRVVAFSDQPLVGELRVGSAGAPPTTTDVRRGGPPYFWLAEIASPSAGLLQATFMQNACPQGSQTTQKITVKKSSSPPAAPPDEGVWSTRAAWTHAFENMYSAWIEALFDAPDGEQPSWSALHEVLRDPRRNFLFDHLGAKEDSSRSAPVIRPDCADLPYFLRAYFAWKMRLPFGLAECSRGGRGRPPACRGLLTNEDPDERVEPVKKDGVAATFGAFLRGTLADRAHSGSARTPFEDENADYYPVKLSWANLRPGTVYADPYGHVLVVAKRVPQTPAHGGVLYAVDGQPDGTVARKRFWRGNFLYARQRELGGPGFKHFRPLIRRKDVESGHLERSDDRTIEHSREYGDVSREAGALDVEGFFDTMDDVLSPRPLDPERAMLETIDALEEQVVTRVKSVDNGRKWLETARGSRGHDSIAPMPEGAEIFETTGPWEDFATPSRDLRLLIAIDVVRGFPATVARRPERYAMPVGKTAADVATSLAASLERELMSRTAHYTRTDGSSQTLTLAEVLSRSSSFEMTYNPNDCVELRWGAVAGTNEASTCRAHAPVDQTSRMETYRSWFHERRRPPRR